MKIEYKRARKGPSYATVQTVWPSKCGRFKLEEHVGIFEQRTRWYALYFDHTIDFWRMLEHTKTYRTRQAADRALEKFRRILDGEYKPRKKMDPKKKAAKARLKRAR